MDVHPLSQPIHTLKDFLLHLLSITVGLFIALSLEAAVEGMHHRHLVRDSRLNLDREIVINRQLYIDDTRFLQENRKQLERDIEQLRVLRTGKKLEHSELGWHWEWNSFSGAAWRAARDSGAVSYMDPSLISLYSWMRSQQDYVNSTAFEMVAEESKAGAALEVANDRSNLTAPEIQTLLLKSAEIKLSLQTLKTVMGALDQMYSDKALELL